jgi:hypothetical protein
MISYLNVNAMVGRDLRSLPFEAISVVGRAAKREKVRLALILHFVAISGCIAPAVQ